MDEKLKARYLTAVFAEWTAEQVCVASAPKPSDADQLAYAKARARSRSAYEVLREAWLADRAAE